MPDRKRLLDYASPQDRPPPKDYCGCLIPFGVAVACLGLNIFLLSWSPSRMSPGERRQEILRLAEFIALAAVPVVAALLLRRRS
jgi:hypothetical protein